MLIEEERTSKKRRQKKWEKQKTKKIMSCHCRHRKNVISHNNEPRFWATQAQGCGWAVGGGRGVHDGGARDGGCLARLTVAGANGARLMTGEPSLAPSRADSISWWRVYVTHCRASFKFRAHCTLNRQRTAAAFCQLILNGNKKYIKSVSLIPELMSGPQTLAHGTDWGFLAAIWAGHSLCFLFAIVFMRRHCQRLTYNSISVQTSTVATKSELRIEGALKVFALKARQTNV